MTVWIVSASLIAGLLGAGGLGSVIVERMRLAAKARSGTRENVMIDQLQESNGDLSKRLSKAETRIDDLMRRERILIGYVYELYAHIAEGKPPPPPPLPELTL